MNFNEELKTILNLPENTNNEMFHKKKKLENILKQTQNEKNKNIIIEKIVNIILNLKEETEIDKIIKKKELINLINLYFKKENNLNLLNKIKTKILEIKIKPNIITAKIPIDHQKFLNLFSNNDKFQNFKNLINCFEPINNNIINEDYIFKKYPYIEIMEYTEDLIYILEILNKGSEYKLIINTYFKYNEKYFFDYLNKILINNKFVNPKNIDSYIKAFKFAFIEKDYETSIQKLIPLLENSIRYIHKQNEINPYRYNTKEETINMIGFLFKSDLMKNLYSENILKTFDIVFDNKKGFNIRNKIAHGIWDSNDYDNVGTIYAICFILYICFYTLHNQKQNNK